MRIGLVQAAGVPGDVAANLATVDRFAARAATQGVRLLVVPECFPTGYDLGAERVAALAEPVDGPIVAELAAIAVRHRLAVLSGHVERDADGAIRNTAVLLDCTGALVHVHRKAHLFGDVDRRAFVAGSDPPAVVELEGLRIGVLVCYDVEFPEAVRALALAGAELVAVPTALMEPAVEVAEVLVPARAIENGLYVAYCNRVGAEGELVYVGRSVVVGPDGTRVALGADEEELLVADVEPEAIRTARSRLHYLGDRRPELYR